METTAVMPPFGSDVTFRTTQSPVHGYDGLMRHLHASIAGNVKMYKMWVCVVHRTYNMNSRISENFNRLGDGCEHTKSWPLNPQSSPAGCGNNT